MPRPYTPPPAEHAADMNRHERTERMFMPHQACTVPGERMTAAERARRRARAKDARAARRRNR